jgi:hypothetical protein
MKVFLSYAHEDQELARRVGDVLEEAGLQIWDAQREILPGDNWALRIGEALQDSHAMVVLLTPHGLASGAVRRDLEYAMGEKSYKHKLIPVILGGAGEMPHEKLPWILKHLPTMRVDPGDQESLRRVARLLTDVP